jgi:hypothetical protein
MAVSWNIASTNTFADDLHWTRASTSITFSSGWESRTFNRNETLSGLTWGVTLTESQLSAATYLHTPEYQTHRNGDSTSYHTVLREERTFVDDRTSTKDAYRLDLGHTTFVTEYHSTATGITHLETMSDVRGNDRTITDHILSRVSYYRTRYSAAGTMATQSLLATLHTLTQTPITTTLAWGTGPGMPPGMALTAATVDTIAGVVTLTGSSSAIVRSGDGSSHTVRTVQTGDLTDGPVQVRYWSPEDTGYTETRTAFVFRRVTRTDDSTVSFTDGFTYWEKSLLTDLSPGTGGVALQAQPWEMLYRISTTGFCLGLTDAASYLGEGASLTWEPEVAGTGYTELPVIEESATTVTDGVASVAGSTTYTHYSSRTATAADYTIPHWLGVIPAGTTLADTTLYGDRFVSYYQDSAALAAGAWAAGAWVSGASRDVTRVSVEYSTAESLGVTGGQARSITEWPCLVPTGLATTVLPGMGGYSTWSSTSTTWSGGTTNGVWVQEYQASSEHVNSALLVGNVSNGTRWGITTALGTVQAWGDEPPMGWQVPSAMGSTSPYYERLSASRELPGIAMAGTTRVVGFDGTSFFTVTRWENGHPRLVLYDTVVGWSGGAYTYATAPDGAGVSWTLRPVGATSTLSGYAAFVGVDAVTDTAIPGPGRNRRIGPYDPAQSMATPGQSVQFGRGIYWVWDDTAAVGSRITCTAPVSTVAVAGLSWCAETFFDVVSYESPDCNAAPVIVVDPNPPPVGLEGYTGRWTLTVVT